MLHILSWEIHNKMSDMNPTLGSKTFAGHLLRSGVDGYLLGGATELPRFLLQINTSELAMVGMAAQSAGQLRFSKAAAKSRVQYLMDSLDSVRNTTITKTRIALFLQMHNATLWWSLRLGRVRSFRIFRVRFKNKNQKRHHLHQQPRESVEL